MTTEVANEKVVITMPKPIMDFLRAHVKSPEEYISERIIPAFDADLQTREDPFFDYYSLVKLYKLKHILDC